MKSPSLQGTKDMQGTSALCEACAGRYEGTSIRSKAYCKNVVRSVDDFWGGEGDDAMGWGGVGGVGLRMGWWVRSCNIQTDLQTYITSSR